jgi:2-keto-4-pentenoate hydratase
MTPTAALAAARMLSGSWRKREHIDALPDTCRPQSRADGYAIQDQWPDEVSDEIAGWKIAATSLAGQKHIQVSGPIAGPIFAHRVHDDDTAVSLTGNRMCVAECEIVFRLDRRFAPRPGGYQRGEVVAAVASVHPGIEIPDSRFAQFERAGEAQLIADCACMNEMVVGAAGVPADPRLLETLPALVVQASVGDGRLVTGLGANALGDPVAALVWLVNELSAHGRSLERGQFVTTGTCLTPVPVSPGDSVAADYGVIGRLGVRFD